MNDSILSAVPGIGIHYFYNLNLQGTNQDLQHKYNN